MNSFKKLLKLLFSFKFLSLVLFVIIILFLSNIETRLQNIEKRFGGTEKLECSEESVRDLLQNSVVRIIGSYAEGSGFPISDKTIITSFHVIEGEPSPKIVFPDGSFTIPTKTLGNKEMDFAVLTLDKKLFPLPIFGWFGNNSIDPNPVFGEPVFSAGYPLGSELPGDVRIIKGSYNGVQYSKDANLNYIEASIQLNSGMSGGPLVNSCGQVLGINTAGISGLSAFAEIQAVQKSFYNLTDEIIMKIEIDTGNPEGVVKAFYTYITARNLEKAFGLLSGERKSKVSSLEDWAKGYSNTLHVNLSLTKVDEENENKIHVKLWSQDWIDKEMRYKYFEGYWIVVEEKGEFRLDQSNIKELDEPSWDWFYEI